MEVTLAKTKVNIPLYIRGESFYSEHLADALRAAQKYAADNNTFVAPMPLLLKIYHYETYTANSEDISGVDKLGKFGPKGGYVVVTLHGGKEGGGILTPDIIEKACDMYQQKKGGINRLGAAKLNDLFYGEDVLTDLLHGNMPDGSSIKVLSYNHLIEYGVPDDFQRYAIVRPMELARKTDSGRESIYRLMDKEGKVTDSQVIVYAGGVQEGQNLIKMWGEHRELGVWHPFNLKEFNPEQPQGRLLEFSSNITTVLFGMESLKATGRFVAVAQEAHSKESKYMPTPLQIKLEGVVELKS